MYERNFDCGCGSVVCFLSVNQTTLDSNLVTRQISADFFI